VVLTGDFNIDLLKIREKTIFNNFFDTILSNGFIPKITFPTRITNHSSTLIDNIFVKLSNNFSCTTSGILLSQISDHLPCFLSLDYLKPLKYSNKYITVWPRSEQAYHNFKTEISQSCTIDIFDENINIDPNDNYEILHNRIQLAYEKHIPVKYVKFKKHRHKISKWITGGLMSSIRFRDKLYKRMKDSFNNPDIYLTLRSNLSSYNCILKKLIREAKKSYYESCFKKFKDDIRKTWDTIKTIINRTKKLKEFPQSFLINGAYISDTQIIANEFNLYFVSVGPKLAANIQSPDSSSFRDYLQSPYQHSFQFEKVSVDVVSKIIDNLKAKSSSGIDHLSNKLLKFIKDDIAIPLTLIINQSIETGIFPDRLKIAKVIPLFKKNEDYLLENYRPISVLPSMSKVLERVMHIQLTNYFSVNNLFYSNQYGFRNSHSTELASLEFINRIVNSMDKNETPLAVYLDLSKAFDTIDHEILLFKLQYYGIRDSSLKLIENYLFNRKQYTSVDNVNSSLLPILTGVPQGSILGPLSFIIYINDLPLASKQDSVIAFSEGIDSLCIKNLEDDIALSLSALGIRIIAPMPGRGTIGIEVPNQNPEIVSMFSIIKSKRFQESKYTIPIALGKTISNESYVVDLTKMPHLLVAGATGQGKSVGLNAIISSILYKQHPAFVKLVLVDPKKVEMTLYEKIERHYLAKLPESEEAIITDNQEVVHTLSSLNLEMDNRYQLLKKAQVRNIKEYNKKFKARKLNPQNGHHFLPYIVLIVDEFADLIMTAGKEIELPIARIAQLARAVGIHLIVATQRPSTNIITGVIKANFPTRIAFKVASMIDSRTILDSAGANQLIGRGDMLITQGSDLIRLQCAFIDTPEVEEITDYIGNQMGYPTAFLLPEPEGGEAGGQPLEATERDDLFEEAARVVVAHQQGSTSMIQRKLSIGYNRAGRIMDQLEQAGIVGAFEGSKARQVLFIDEASLERHLEALQTHGA